MRPGMVFPGMRTSAPDRFRRSAVPLDPQAMPALEELTQSLAAEGAQTNEDHSPRQVCHAHVRSNSDLDNDEDMRQVDGLHATEDGDHQDQTHNPEQAHDMDVAHTWAPPEPVPSRALHDGNGQLQMAEMASAFRGRAGGARSAAGMNICVIDALRQIMDGHPPTSDSVPATEGAIQEATYVRALCGTPRNEPIAIADAWAAMTAFRIGPWAPCPWLLELPLRNQGDGTYDGGHAILHGTAAPWSGHIACVTTSLGSGGHTEPVTWTTAIGSIHLQSIGESSGPAYIAGVHGIHPTTLTALHLGLEVLHSPGSGDEGRDRGAQVAAAWAASAGGAISPQIADEAESSEEYQHAARQLQDASRASEQLSRQRGPQEYRRSQIRRYTGAWEPGTDRSQTRPAAQPAASYLSRPQHCRDHRNCQL